MAIEASELVRRIRTDRKITTRDLAARAQVPQPTIVEIEQGRRQPSLLLLNRIARAADYELESVLVPKPRLPEEVWSMVSEEDARWLSEQLWRYEPLLHYLRDH
ncbi:MAG: helix-turn-helix transcriptional regulator [Acidimicrobiales bacterium]